MKSLRTALSVAIIIAWICAAAGEASAGYLLTNASKHSESNSASVPDLASQMQVGDVVFIRIHAKPFREVADVTNSWTNHVGIVVDVSGEEPLIGESKLPWSRETPLSSFVARSQDGRIHVARLKERLTPEQALRVIDAAHRRDGILYDTGFDLHSHRQFCSRYVYEVLLEATGTAVGEVETFEHLLAARPDANIRFWRVWFFGSIPWKRETVTPASLLRNPALVPVFDGVVKQRYAPKRGLTERIENTVSSREIANSAELK